MNSKAFVLVASQSFWNAREVVKKDLSEELELIFAMDFLIPEALNERVVAIVLADQVFGSSEFDRFPNLKTLARTGTGYDGIDIAEAEKRSICVTRVSILNAESVSEFVLGLFLALSRYISPIHNKMIEGKWERRGGLLLKEMTVGLVGLGNVGRFVAKKLKALGIKQLMGWNRTLRLEVQELVNDCGLQLVNLPLLFSSSDIVVIALSLTHATRGLVDRNLLSLLKPESMLINVGRGAVLDEDYLADMVCENRIGGVALDVYSSEWPEPMFEQPFVKKLITAAKLGKNVILTPHNAATTKNNSQYIALQVGRNIVKVLRGETEGLEIVKTDQE